MSKTDAFFSCQAETTGGWPPPRLTLARQRHETRACVGRLGRRRRGGERGWDVAACAAFAPLDLCLTPSFPPNSQTLHAAAFATPATVLAYHRASNGCPSPAATDWDSSGVRVVQFSVPIIAPPLVRRALRGLDRINVVEHQQLTWRDAHEGGGFVVDGTPVLDAQGGTVVTTAARVVATPVSTTSTRLTSTIAVSAGGPKLLASAVEAAMVAQAADAAAAYVAACASAGAAAAKAPPPPPPRVVVGGGGVKGDDVDGEAFHDASDALPLSRSDAEAILTALDRLQERASDLTRDVRVARGIVWAACPSAAPWVARRVVEGVRPTTVAWCAAGVAVGAAVVAVMACRRRV